MKYLAILGGHDSEALLAGDDSVISIEQQVNNNRYLHHTLYTIHYTPYTIHHRVSPNTWEGPLSTPWEGPVRRRTNESPQQTPFTFFHLVDYREERAPVKHPICVLFFLQGARQSLHLSLNRVERKTGRAFSPVIE